MRNGLTFAAIVENHRQRFNKERQRDLSRCRYFSSLRMQRKARGVSKGVCLLCLIPPSTHSQPRAFFCAVACVGVRRPRGGQLGCWVREEGFLASLLWRCHGDVVLVCEA